VSRKHNTAVVERHKKPGGRRRNDCYSRVARGNIEFSGATCALLKLFPNFGFKLIGCHSYFASDTRIFANMVLLRKRSRGSAWEDWKKDPWPARAAFGLFLAALAAWLAVLHRGPPLSF